MIHPKRLDGNPLRVVSLTDGRVFVEPTPVMGEDGFLLHRGGPEHPRHCCRFQDYGLADGLVRCRKCGLVIEGSSRLAGFDGVEVQPMKMIK